MIRHIGAEDRIEIRKELAANLPAIHLDRDQIRQVLLNILLNSSDSMPNGGILEIRAGTGDSDPQITVDINDSGTGIPDEGLDHIFDLFFTTKDQKTGPGLSISYHLVQNHGETIEAFKNKDKGLMFHMELPSGT